MPVEDRQAAAPVGAPGEALPGQSAVEPGADGAGRVDRGVVRIDRERGDVDVERRGLRERLRLLEEPRVPVHVRGMKDARRQLGLRERARDGREAPRSVAEVQVQHARLAAREARDVAVGGQAHQLVEGRLRAPVVRDGGLARAHDRVAEDDVAAHRAGEG
ncbi:MAG: hypothetical protein ACK559_20835, partial [bacterium]